MELGERLGEDLGLPEGGEEGGGDIGEEGVRGWGEGGGGCALRKYMYHVWYKFSLLSFLPLFSCSTNPF